ncbi:hypothetical protein AC578_2387 [Pseudocercospora eumusae]|uniref:Uncharacterized protein n=1 Tax=Pseudocercospora eumusae TaxID=321146 RepID=A0A139HXV2_9PEZI|nr:hypothetical protein AC578_2387 [Pseudocercospora eumusae]
MSTENPNYNVGGTAKDGGLSTADTVADGDVDGGNRPSDSPYEPDGDVAGKAAPKETRSKTESSNNSSRAHVGNENFGVGGTSKDGGLSTADTVADGGPDDAEEDEDFKP